MSSKFNSDGKVWADKLRRGVSESNWFWVFEFAPSWSAYHGLIIPKMCTLKNNTWVWRGAIQWIEYAVGISCEGCLIRTLRISLIDYKFYYEVVLKGGRINVDQLQRIRSDRDNWRQSTAKLCAPNLIITNVNLCGNQNKQLLLPPD
jgi:hypothetical protein